MALLQWLKESGWQPPLLFEIVLIIIVLQFFRKNKRKFNLPPGPLKFPIVGNLYLLGSTPHLSLQRLAHKYGPIFYLKLGEIPTVVVSSAKMAEKVMKTHDLALASRPLIFSAKHLFYGCTDIAFAPYGDYWRNARKICILELLSAKQVQTYKFVREEEVARLVCRVAEAYPGTTNLTKKLGLYANNVLFRVALGKDFSAEGDYDRQGFQHMLEEYQVLLGGFSVGDFFPSLEFVHSLTGMKSRLQNTFQRFDQFFDEVIFEHLSPERNEQQEHKDLVDVLLDIQKNGSDGTPLTTDNIKAIMLDMFAAGTDTTFITLDWGMTELIMHPKVMEKAQAEVRSIVGDRKLVKESDIPQLRYMKAVIKEILRLHPPVPVLLPRESMEDVIIDGHDIPAKTRLFVNAWAIGRDKESWENPETFEPERFMDNSIDFRGQDFQLIPFGAGRRGCPAITFGIATVELALAQLLHSFDWELPPGIQIQDLDMTEVFGISMHKISDLNILAKPHFS